jgi:two-component system response regulator NreC
MAMPQLGGLDVTGRLKQDLPDCKILILSQYNDADYVLPILQAGADGYVVKKAGGSEVLRAIKAVANGDVYLHPSIVQLVLEATGRQYKPMQDATAKLTRREKEVLTLVGSGKTNQQIADTLVISLKTVDKHRASLLRKLGLPNRAALIRYAILNTPAHRG